MRTFWPDSYFVGRCAVLSQSNDADKHGRAAGFTAGPKDGRATSNARRDHLPPERNIVKTMLRRLF